MSLRTWESFSPEDRALVTEAARYSVGVMRSLWDARVEDAKKTLIESGGTILTDIDSTPFRDLMRPVYEQFVTPDIKSYVEAIDRIGEQGT